MAFLLFVTTYASWIRSPTDNLLDHSPSEPHLPLSASTIEVQFDTAPPLHAVFHVSESIWTTVRRAAFYDHHRGCSEMDRTSLPAFQLAAAYVWASASGGDRWVPLWSAIQLHHEARIFVVPQHVALPRLPPVPKKEKPLGERIQPVLQPEKPSQHTVFSSVCVHRFVSLPEPPSTPSPYLFAGEVNSRVSFPLYHKGPEPEEKEEGSTFHLLATVTCRGRLSSPADSPGGWIEGLQLFRGLYYESAVHSPLSSHASPSPCCCDGRSRSLSFLTFSVYDALWLLGGGEEGEEMNTTAGRDVSLAHVYRAAERVEAAQREAEGTVERVLKDAAGLSFSQLFASALKDHGESSTFTFQEGWLPFALNRPDAVLTLYKCLEKTYKKRLHGKPQREGEGSNKAAGPHAPELNPAEAAAASAWERWMMNREGRKSLRCAACEVQLDCTLACVLRCRAALLRRLDHVSSSPVANELSEGGRRAEKEAETLKEAQRIESGLIATQRLMEWIGERVGPLMSH